MRQSFFIESHIIQSEAHTVTTQSSGHLSRTIEALMIGIAALAMGFVPPASVLHTSAALAAVPTGDDVVLNSIAFAAFVGKAPAL